MEVTDTFHCLDLGAEKMKYELCLIRQQAMMLPNSKCRHPKYITCYDCEKGKGKRAMFPNWQYVKQDKRKKPDRIYLRKKQVKDTIPFPKKSVLRTETKPDAVFPPSFPPPVKLAKSPFNANLFVRAQCKYIKTLITAGKTVEAKERLDLAKKELYMQGIVVKGYKEFEGVLL